MTFNEKQFRFMPDRRTFIAVFILRQLLEEYYARCYVCFVDLEKAVDGVPRIVFE